MNVTPHFAWTPEAVARLKELADGTRSATEIASTLGCGRNAVIGKLNRMRAAGKLASTVKLMEGHGSHGRARKRDRDAPKARAEPVAVSWANGTRIAPKKGKPTEPVFFASRAEGAAQSACAPVASQSGRTMGYDGQSALRASSEMPPIASDHALTLPPITFDEAIERNRCLFFAGDPYSPAGPGMPVCGAERPQWSTGGSRYCTRHRLAQYAPRRAA